MDHKKGEKIVNERSRGSSQEKVVNIDRISKDKKCNEDVEKEKPSLALSGNLAKDTNLVNGIVVKYNQPPEARKPRRRWRLYCFKGDTELPFYQIHRQSAYLFGRDRLVADIPVDHPSCSKQHAVLQYRLVEYKRKDESTGRIVKPYIIDLSSTNGTFVNNQQLEAQRYFELIEKDVIKFGFSSREYVLLHEESKNNLDNESFNEDTKEVNETDITIKKENETKEIRIDNESIKNSLKRIKSKKQFKRSQKSSSSSEMSFSEEDREKKKKKIKHLE